MKQTSYICICYDLELVYIREHAIRPFSALGMHNFRCRKQKHRIQAVHGTVLNVEVKICGKMLGSCELPM